MQNSIPKTIKEFLEVIRNSEDGHFKPIPQLDFFIGGQSSENKDFIDCKIKVKEDKTETARLWGHYDNYKDFYIDHYSIGSAEEKLQAMEILYQYFKGKSLINKENIVDIEKENLKKLNSEMEENIREMTEDVYTLRGKTEVYDKIFERKEINLNL